MTPGKTLILGATPNPQRYAYLATSRLLEHGHEVVPVGIRKGAIEGVEIINDLPYPNELDTVTLYLGPARQPEYYNYILTLKPRRVIFNPGTENTELAELLRENDIEVVEGCTLVMLSAGTF